MFPNYKAVNMQALKTFDAIQAVRPFHGNLLICNRAHGPLVEVMGTFG